MPSRDLIHLHPDISGLCSTFLWRCRKENINAFITCTYRSSAEQNELYEQGRTKPGAIVTNAKGGQSKHNLMLGKQPASKAFDIAIKNADGSLNWDGTTQPWQRAGEIGEALGLIWGGKWKRRDYAHFEIE